MGSQQTGLHHYHKKKKGLTQLFDRFMYIVAIVFPLTTLPQAIKIWVSQSAQDVSMITWSAYVVSASCWLIYSIIHKEKVLIINSALWVLLESSVLVGAIVYG